MNMRLTPEQESSLIEAKRLSCEICGLLSDLNASPIQGVSALMITVILTLVDHNMKREDALTLFAQCWDIFAPGMAIEMAKRKGPMQ